MLTRAVKVIGLLTLLAAFAFPSAALASHHGRSHGLTAHQKKVIRAKLLREIRHNPRMIKNKAWLREAVIVHFSLPVAIRLNPVLPGPTPVPNQQGNDNYALLDLGPSLGVRRIGLDGSLAANLTFNDEYSGGLPGDVNLSIPGPQPAGYGLVSTSVPLLANPNVDSNTPNANPAVDGCLATGAGAAFAPYLPSSSADADWYGNLAASDSPSPSTDNNVGDDTNPFPGTATYDDTVLRTGSLSLDVANASADTSDGVPVGISGGVANLFGLTPAGAPAGTNVDVKVSLSTNINSIIRTVDAASLYSGNTAPFNGANPFGNTDCRQAWTGYVANLLKTELTGQLQISPAITGDGKLRIARVQLTGAPVSQSVTACLVPFNVYSGTIAALPTGYTPGGRNGPPVPGPSTECNEPGPIQTAGAAALVGGGGSGASGATVQVSGELSVPHLNAEVLVGQ